MASFSGEMAKCLNEGIFSRLGPKEGADLFVSLLEKYGYKFIASDFDATMIARHSGGYLDPKVDVDVLASVTPDFKAVGERIKSTHIRLAVVTFSDALAVQGHRKYISGEEMVRLALEMSRCTANVEKVYAFYPKFWTSRDMYQRIGLDAPMPKHKEYHLRKICEDFGVELSEIVLLDDDINNCINAAKIGATALHVTGEGFCLAELAML